MIVLIRSRRMRRMRSVLRSNWGCTGMDECKIGQNESGGFSASGMLGWALPFPHAIPRMNLSIMMWSKLGASRTCCEAPNVVGELCCPRVA